MALSLLAICLLARVLSIPAAVIFQSPWSPVAYLYQDLVLALGLYVLERRISSAWVPRVAYAILAIWIAVNLPIVRILSTPLTWPALRAARGTLWDSIHYYLTPSNVALVIFVISAAAVLPMLLNRWGCRIPATAVALSSVIAGLGPLAVAHVDTHGMHRNPAAAMILSLLPRTTASPPVKASFPVPLGGRIHEDLSGFRGIASGRNIILVGLESTAAAYLGLYGAREDAMPNLTLAASRGIVFENAYTVYPESVKILYPVLFSIYPPLDREVDGIDLSGGPSLVKALSDRGYASALFHSGRFMYLGMDTVVGAAGFETLEDAGHIGGNHNSSFGVDEESTVGRILNWIDARPQGRPFFLTYLPIAGHHPYAALRGGPFSEADEPGRYKNALFLGDSALGELIAGVEKRGLTDETIWVFYGDHGEAFGQHPGNFGHTFFLYEENVRVPLLVILPKDLSQLVRVGHTASLIDLPPTILDLLGAPIPDDFEGRSLLSGISCPALFFTDYSLGLIGARDGKWKIIHELESGRTRLFDLSCDPSEQADVSALHPQMTLAYRRGLLSWCGFIQRKSSERPSLQSAHAP